MMISDYGERFGVYFQHSGSVKRFWIFLQLFIHLIEK